MDANFQIFIIFKTAVYHLDSTYNFQLTHDLELAWTTVINSCSMFYYIIVTHEYPQTCHLPKQKPKHEPRSRRGTHCSPNNPQKIH